MSADLRTFLRANMLDGDEGGKVTMTCGALLGEVCDLVGDWLRGEAVDEPIHTLTLDEARKMLDGRS